MHDLPQAPPVDPLLLAKVQRVIDEKTKPPGSLGQLEDLALQICGALNQEEPEIKNAQALIFAGDHGAASNGISAYPAEVTAQMVQNFLQGGAAINAFCKLHDLDFRVVDAGVSSRVEPHPALIDRKIASGTQDYLRAPAMSPAQVQEAIKAGMELAKQAHQEERSLLLLGEMGIGNSSSAALLTHCITKIPLEDCIGAGTGQHKEDLQKKRELLEQARQRGGCPDDPFLALAEYGGFEGAMMVGTMIKAASQRQLVLVDGFIVTASALVACELCPSIRPYLIFAHRSLEAGHVHSLTHLRASPLLELDLRLGEGTGAALAYPLLLAATAFLREMASFASAGVSKTKE